MSDREALAAAIKWELGETPLEPYERTKDHQSTIVAAARERLPQLPPYPPALVERIAKALVEGRDPDWVQWKEEAVAVLDALNTEPL